MRLITLTALTTYLAVMALPAFAATGNTAVFLDKATPVVQPTDTESFSKTCPDVAALLIPQGAAAGRAELADYEASETPYAIITAGNAAFHIELEATDIPDLVKGFSNKGGWLVVMPLSDSDQEAAATMSPAPIGKLAIFTPYYNGDGKHQDCTQIISFQPIVADDLATLPPALSAALTRALSQAHK